MPKLVDMRLTGITFEDAVKRIIATPPVPLKKAEMKKPRKPRGKKP